ncbi:MAG: alpha-amylase family glycosyl hydrolase, partial [Firmicutes bacterium]|nr:alpha-amylase family glycosyl hydrolase [Bacillota bacterium]
YGGPKSVAEYWIENGASGWRLDSADNGNFSIPWWSAFRSAVKSVDPQAAIVGEIWNNATNDSGTDWLTGQTFDSVMNYQFRNAVIDFFRGTYDDGNENHTGVDASGFNARLMRLYSEYPLTSFYAMMNLVDSQDTMRILSVLSNAPDPTTMTAYQQATWQPSASDLAVGIVRLKLVSDFQFGFPGDPTVYYGDEAGMLGYKDPLNRGPYPWGQANEDLVNHYRLLGAIRNANPVLQTGTFEPLLEQGNVYAFARTITGGQDVFGSTATDASAIVAMNNQATPTTVTVPVNGTVADGTQMLDELTGTWYTVEQGTVTLNLTPYQGVILISNPTAPVAYMQREGAQTVVAWTPIAATNAHYQVWVQGEHGNWHAAPIAPAVPSALSTVQPGSTPATSMAPAAPQQPMSADITNLRGAQALQVMVSATVPGQPAMAPGQPGAAGGPVTPPATALPPLPPGSVLSNAVTVPAVNLSLGTVSAAMTPQGVQVSFPSVPGATQYSVYAEQPDGSYVLVDSVGTIGGSGQGSTTGPATGVATGGTIGGSASVPVPPGPQVRLLVTGTTATTFRVSAANEDDIVFSPPLTASAPGAPQPPAAP